MHFLHDENYTFTQFVNDLELLRLIRRLLIRRGDFAYWSYLQINLYCAPVMIGVYILLFSLVNLTVNY
jgi:hypothetical protein